MVDRTSRSEMYNGHRIELGPEQTDENAVEERAESAAPVLRIDDAPVAHGQLPDGLFFLNDYAYDWQDDLMELARRFVDYRERAAEGSVDESKEKE